MSEVAKIDLLIEGAKAATTLGELETNAENLLTALKETEVGSKEYKKLEKQLISTSRQVKNLELSFESLDNEQVASEIGSVAGAIGDVTAAFILLGGENEELEEIAQNIEKGLGVSIAFKGAIEGLTSASKLLKAANPFQLYVTLIAAVTVGIGFLIVKWDKFVDAIKGSVGVLLNIFEDIKQSITGIGQSMAEREAIEQLHAKRRENRNKEASEQHRQRVFEIESQQEATTKAFEDKKRSDELQLKRDEALGKSSFALKQEILQNIIDEEKGILESNQAIIDSAVQRFKQIALLNGISEEEFLRRAKAQGVDLLLIQKEADALLQKQRDKIFQAETDLLALEKGQRDKNSADKKAQDAEDAAADQKLADEKAAQDQKDIDDAQMLLDRKIAAINEADKIEISNIKDKDEKKKAQLIFAFEESILLLDENITEENDLIIAKRLELEGELALIDEEKAQRELELQEKKDEKEAQEKQDTIDQAFNTADQLINITEKFASIAGSKELKRINAKKARGEALTKNEIKRLQQEEKTQKAFALAQIGFDTARGISAAVAAGAGIPFPGNIPAILSGVAAVLSGVAQAQSILGEGSSVDVGSIAGDTGGGFEDETQNIPSVNEVAFGSTLLNQEPQIVAIVDDINEGQDRVATIVQQATFGMIVTLIGICSCMF